jgi:hypothetical protein
MKAKPARTSIDLPRELNCRLHEAAARQGCSARQLILAGIQRAVEDATPRCPRWRLSLDRPIVAAAKRKPFDLNNEQIYQLIEFPWCQRLDGTFDRALAERSACCLLLQDSP